MINFTKEKEITVMAKVGDYNGFKQAEKVVNIQELTTFLEGKGKYRGRKITGSEGTSYIANIKTSSKGTTVKTSVDEDSPVTASYFEAMRLLADNMTVRDRFTFSGSTATIVVEGKEILLPAIDYDVDVFQRHDGKTSDWVKIDIEINKISDTVEGLGISKDAKINIVLKVTHLPIKPQKAFIVNPNNTPRELEVISKFWEEFKQNPFGGPVKEVEANVYKPPVKDPGTPPVNNDQQDNQNNQGQESEDPGAPPT